MSGNEWTSGRGKGREGKRRRMGEGTEGMLAEKASILVTLRAWHIFIGVASTFFAEQECHNRVKRIITES